MAVDVEERNSKWMNLATLLGLVILGVLLWHRQKPLIVLAITLGCSSSFTNWGTSWRREPSGCGWTNSRLGSGRNS